MSYNAFNAAKDLITGKLQVADEETVKQRREICDGCEVRNKLDICTACGCVLSAKIRLSQSSCPMELW